MLGAILAAAAFIRRNRLGSLSVYALNVVMFGSVLAAYALAAPGAGAAGASMWVAFTIGQIYVIARLWVKLLFWASETAFFQDRLAHAGYVRQPEPEWPDSPAAEALTH